MNNVDSLMTSQKQRILRWQRWQDFFFEKTTMVFALIGFDFFLAFVEDDPTEIFSFLVLALALAGGLGLVLAFDIQYFYMVSALGGGNAALVAFNDLVANALCVLRIFSVSARILSC